MNVLAIWIIVALILIYIVAIYNRLIVLKTRINNAWSQIDVQLKRRADLIPNLVSTVKGYTKHERTVLQNVTKARASLQKAETLNAKAKASDAITTALKSLFAVAENYPDLKANKNFLLLQEELAGTESKIAYSRQFYNDNVMGLNASIQRFPTNVIANIFNFKKRDYFRTEGKAREAVKVEF